jgi:hypothetical protein
VGAWLCCRAVPLWAALGHTGPSSRARASWLGSARCSSKLKYLARLGSPPTRELRAIFPALGDGDGKEEKSLKWASLLDSIDIWRGKAG